MTTPDEQLLTAAGSGDVAAAKAARAAGARLTGAKTAGTSTAFQHAAFEGHLGVLEYLLGEGAELDGRRSGNGATALLLAAHNGHADAVDWLLQRGADVHTTRDDGATPLFGAAWFGHSAVVQSLRRVLFVNDSEGALPGAQSESLKWSTWAALEIALESGHKDVADILSADPLPEWDADVATRALDEVLSIGVEPAHAILALSVTAGNCELAICQLESDRENQAEMAKANALEQLMGVSEITVAGWDEYAGVYRSCGEHEGWPRFRTSDGKHLFRCIPDGEWYLMDTFDPDAQAPAALCFAPDGVLPEESIWECSINGHWADQMLTCTIGLIRPVLGPAPEPEPHASSEPPLNPAVLEYTRYGISADGLMHVRKLFQEELNRESLTTSDVCQRLIKPRTMPPGSDWVDIPELITIDAKGNDVSHNGWYKHLYRKPDGSIQSDPPSGTHSFCRLLALDASTATFVGKPTHFLSHAWGYLFEDVVDAVRAFDAQNSSGEQAETAYYWFDCLSLDQHANNAQGSLWWSTTFMTAIGMMGHTVMVLSPWDAPQPLTRSWCLWELYCTVETGSKFTITLSPAEEHAFEESLITDFDAAVAALAQINVEDAKAGNESDRVMILDAAKGSKVGVAGLNNLAAAKLRQWVLQKARRYVSTLAQPDGSLRTERAIRAGWQVGAVLDQCGAHHEAWALLEHVVSGSKELFGADSQMTLQAEMNVAITLQSLGQLDEARTILEQVLSQLTASSASDLDMMYTCQHNLARLMRRFGEHSAAKDLLEEVVAGRIKLYGPTDSRTLKSRSSLASTRSRLGDYAAARSELGLLLRETAAALGPRDSFTMAVQYNLALVIASQASTTAEYDASLRLMREVEQSFATVFGTEHHKTLQARGSVEHWECERRVRELRPLAALSASKQAQDFAAIVVSGFPKLMSYSALLKRSVDLASFNGTYHPATGIDQSGFPVWRLVGSSPDSTPDLRPRQIDENVRWLYFLCGTVHDWVFSTELRSFDAKTVVTNVDSDATVCWAKTKLGCNVWGNPWIPENMIGGVVSGARQQWIAFSGEKHSGSDSSDSGASGGACDSGLPLGSGSGSNNAWIDVVLSIELQK